MVEYVEKFAPELDAIFLSDGELLEHGVIEVPAARTAQNVASSIPVSKLAGRGPGGVGRAKGCIEPAVDRLGGGLAGLEAVGAAAAGVRDRGRQSRSEG